jgi:phosphohistidine phosphatase
MKTLLILRHAKSSWKDEEVADHDRPLNKRGKRDAPKIGTLLAQSQLEPELIISSTAKRARKTASKVAKKCHYEGVIELDGSLYLAPPSQYIQVLRLVPDHVRRVMVVGHNPGEEELLVQLTGQEVRFPTAALAHIEIDVISWQDLTDQTRGRLVNLWRPGEID